MKDTASSPLKPIAEERTKGGELKAKKQLNMLPSPTSQESTEVPPPPPSYVSPRDRKKQKQQGDNDNNKKQADSVEEDRRDQ